MVPAEWRELSIDQIKAGANGAIAIGPFGSRMKSDLYTSTGVPVIRGNNISETRSFVGDFVYVSPQTADALAVSNVFPGDLVFPHRGAIGEVGIVPSDGEKRYILSSSLMKVTCDVKIIDPVYLFYFFRSSEGRHELLKNASTVGTPGIGQPLSTLRSIWVPVPPLDEQRDIAHILGTLDDKIELNRRMNETLEAMARALFKSWFVDFDPVRAKAEGRDPGLPKSLTDLFPDSFEDSALGRIPATWRVKTLGDVIDLTYGKALKEGNRQHGAVPVYGSNGLVGWHNEKLADGPGIIVGRKGNPGVVTWAPTDFFAIDTTFYVVPKTECKSLYFLFHALRDHGLSALGADSAVPGLNRNMAYMSKQLVPPQAVLRAFDLRVRLLYERLQRSNDESQTLAALRDTLLPRLISGEIRVKG